MSVTTSRLWAAQDALKTALAAAYTAASIGDPVDLGFPRTLQPDHTWIAGRADVEQTYVVSNLEAPDEAFALVVDILVTLGGTYEEVRDRLMARATALETAIRSDAFLGGSVSDATTATMRVREGVTDDGRRQLGLEITIACAAYLVG